MFEESIGYGEIELVTPYDVKTLHDLTLFQAINEHATLHLTGVIPDEKKDACLHLVNSKDCIEVYQNKNGQRHATLFKGYVTEIKIQMVRGVYQISLKAISATYQLDIKRNSCSFQSEEKTYEHIINKVINSYAEADFINSTKSDIILPNFILQYKETDWQFLKRMASQLGSFLVASIETTEPKFWFGLPERKSIELNVQNYKVTKDCSYYLKNLQNNPKQTINEQDKIVYTIQTTKLLSIGDRIRLKEKELIVFKASSIMQKGTLIYEYNLLPEAGICQATLSIPYLKGVSIEGTVLEVKQEKVRLHLAIDENQNKEEAVWFPLTSMYVAEGHSGWYSPPELGDTVLLTFPNHQEEMAVVSHSIRKEAEVNLISEDASSAIWATPGGKEIRLDQQAITITAKQDTIYTQMDEESGIEMDSALPLIVKSSGDISISGKSIELLAEESLRITCASSSLVQDGMTDIQGQTVKMEGSLNLPVSESNSTEELDELALGLDVVGMLPLAGGID